MAQDTKPGRLRKMGHSTRATVVVIGSVSLVCALRYLVDDWLADHLPYLLFLGAVAASARFAGIRAGAGAIVASLVAGAFFFVWRRLEFSTYRLDTMIEAGVFVVVSSAILAALETEARLRQRLLQRNDELRAAAALRVELERELESARRLESIGRLAGGIAHDFNNLLTVVLGSAELLRAEVPQNPLLESLMLAAERGTDLTKQLLRFARREPMRVQPMSVDASVRETLSLMERLLPEDVAVVANLNAPEALFEGDPSLVQQVILNLVTNARDAIQHQGTISVHTEAISLDKHFASQHAEVCPGEYVLLRVSDTGGGISDEARQRLFEPFFTTKERGEGTGLGLAVAYGIVKQLRGHIFVHSQLGQGTTFEIYWPRVHHCQPPCIASAEHEGPGPARRLSVLLVEDDDAVRDISARLLRDLGHQVVAERSGAEAFARLQRDPCRFDALVTDVVMPRMNGRQLADAVWSILPQMPVVFVSGYTDDILSNRGVIAGDALLVPKPFTSSEIEQALGRATAHATTNSRGDAERASLREGRPPGVAQPEPPPT